MISLILPTYNEAENIPLLVPKIVKALQKIPFEIFIVDDDSPDETWKVAQNIAKKIDNVHVIRRIDRRGLSSAVIDGFLAAKGDVLAVMDADGQHDMSKIVDLYAAVQKNTGIAIGSRYIEGGSIGEWDEQRYFMSRMATRLAKKLCAVQVQDPMSGFFAIHRTAFEKALPSLNPKGFKILLDLLVHIPADTTVVEVPFTFGVRTHGSSKLSRRVQLEFVEYLYDVVLGKYIPLVFVKYCVVGSLGVLVHATAFEIFAQFTSFSWAVIAAIETAIIFNFLLNNAWTFSRERLRGMAAFFGFLKFNGACLFGALASYAVTTYLYSYGYAALLSVIFGAFTGVVWNYTMNRIFTWRA